MIPDIAVADHAVAVVIGAAAIIGAVGSPALLWWLSRQFASRAVVASLQKTLNEYRISHEEDHDDLGKRLDEGERQFASIKADLEHLPDHKDLDDLKKQIGSIDGSVRALAATVDGVMAVMERIERPLNMLVDRHMGEWKK